MSRNILEAIVAAKFLATESQVEQLAGLVAVGQRAGGTYLGVLVAHVQEAFSDRGRKPSVDATLAVLDSTHEHLYAHVLKGIGNEEMPAPERNRRATFARTAASDLRYFVQKGGDVRKLDPAEVSKAQLRKIGRAVPTGTRAERSFVRSFDALVRATRRIARTQPDEAVERARQAIADLEALVEELEAGEQPAPRRRKRAESPRVTRARLHRTPAAPPANH
jgi:hypothetical protein